MTDTDALRSAFRDAKPQSQPQSKRSERRARRADATRRQALSPVRILMSVLLVPVVAGGMTMSIYIRTSPFEREDALRHLIAMSGCSAATKVGVAKAARGEPGYHERHDSNHDGIACNENDPVFMTVFADGADTPTTGPTPARSAGGAKFIKP